MASYVLKRLLLMIPTLLGIIVITFAVVHLAPGDPATLMSQSAESSSMNEGSAKSIVEETKKLYGLDKPLPVQFLRWVQRAVTLDFGNSYRDHRPVMEKIWEALPITLLLNIITIFIIYIISVPLGIYTAVKPRGVADRVVSVVLLVFYSLPSFWVAIMLMVIFGSGDYLNWLPITGILSHGADKLPWYEIVMNISWHLILPIVCLTYGGFAFLSRFTRASMLEVIRQDYIRTARAKGLSEWRVIMKHGVRNALIPILTLMGTLLPALLGGSVIIEQIFSIPGMGRLGFESILSRDYPVIMAIATISAMLTLVSILLSDVMYKVVDPRITFDKREG
ncbi:MAG: ABC transporter permease [Deltaproteobacteria bacterium]|nr:ABC transporter permease [Deltaproteobacteria bacterium]